jgi:hypothetical protein
MDGEGHRDKDFPFEIERCNSNDADITTAMIRLGDVAVSCISTQNWGPPIRLFGGGALFWFHGAEPNPDRTLRAIVGNCGSAWMNPR